MIGSDISVTLRPGGDGQPPFIHPLHDAARTQRAGVLKGHHLAVMGAGHALYVISPPLAGTGDALHLTAAAEGFVRRADVFKGNKKALPVRYCKTCRKPMTWRKKWEKCWDEVMYCSERCRRQRNKQQNENGASAEPDA